MRSAQKKLRTAVVPFDPRKGIGAVERFARAAAKLRDSGKADHVAVAVAAAAAMAEILEDMEDKLLYQTRAHEPTIPHDVVVAIHQGANPIRAWRTYKKLTLQQLAAAAGHMPVGYLSEIETGKKPGSVAAHKALARALGTEIDLLVAEWLSGKAPPRSRGGRSSILRGSTIFLHPAPPMPGSLATGRRVPHV